jgi:transcriptional regulator with XRE-family HTH domain
MKLFREALGEILREERLSQALILRQVASQAPIALAFLSELENGKKEMSSGVLERVAFALGTPASELIIRAGMRMAGLDVPDTARELIEKFDEYADLIPQK